MRGKTGWRGRGAGEASWQVFIIIDDCSNYAKNQITSFFWGGGAGIGRIIMHAGGEGDRIRVFLGGGEADYRAKKKSKHHGNLLETICLQAVTSVSQQQGMGGEGACLKPSVCKLLHMLANSEA